jgi:hypothetical protein
MVAIYKMSTTTTWTTAASEVATISMVNRFDNANQLPQGSGVGAFVGRTVGDVATGAG